MRKYIILCMSALVLSGCQSYPKNPLEVGNFDKRVPINKTIPNELQPYYVYKPIQKQGNQEVVPNLLYVLTSGETAEEVQIRLERKGIVATKSDLEGNQNEK
ncbi:hypothetical protein ACG9ZJ_21335 [Acinetobacter sp. ULE_I064]|uniref:hypothetical protein n=1 Tax=Acinetobacter sp. ULE_I064 TaxID=3373071 RepID=UPI003AF886F3